MEIKILSSSHLRKFEQLLILLRRVRPSFHYITGKNINSSHFCKARVGIENSLDLVIGSDEYCVYFYASYAVENENRVMWNRVKKKNEKR